MRDYIVAHYRLNQRTDTEYWKENAGNAHLSDGLKAMMTAWFRREDIASANEAAYHGKGYYASASWHCLFAGYGTFPERPPVTAPGTVRTSGDLEKVRELLDACCLNFRPYTIGATAS